MRLNAEIRRAMRTLDLLARLDNEGAISAPGSPEEFAAFIVSEIARWAAVLKRAGIEAQ
jgi:tripartite-type tricarboxylate transporter receptor subunit TctC